MSWFNLWGKAKRFGVSVSVTLGSGYSVETENREAAAALTERLEAACDNPAWNSLPDGTTYCNYFCQQVAHAFGIKDLDQPNGAPLMAADMGPKLREFMKEPGCPWREVSMAKAQELANRGEFVLGWAGAPEGEHHGHVVVIAPGEMENSASFGYPVPLCASIAKYDPKGESKNRIDKVSIFYRADNKPVYFWHDSSNG